MLSVDYSTSVEIINNNFQKLSMDNVDLSTDMQVAVWVDPFQMFTVFFLN